LALPSSRESKKSAKRLLSSRQWIPLFAAEGIKPKKKDPIGPRPPKKDSFPIAHFCFTTRDRARCFLLSPANPEKVLTPSFLFL